MAFKLKSGNKVSFKKMGSSPAKQSYDTSLSGADEGALAAIQNTKDKLLLEQKYANERRKARLEAINNIPTKEERRTKNIEEERASRDEYDEAGKLIKRGKELVEGVDFKSKEKLKQEKKTRRFKTKERNKELRAKVKSGDMTKGEKKLVKKGFRKMDKDQKLKDRAARERGTGKSKARVNWKTYALTGKLSESIEHDAKYKSTEKKIAKRKAKDKVKQTRKEGQEDRGGSKWSKTKKKIGGIFKKK
jgi:hypothetical protein